MKRRHYREHGRFLALRACWVILRGGSVAYQLNITGRADALSSPSLFVDCQLAGKPMTPWGIEHGDPQSQPD